MPDKSLIKSIRAILPESRKTAFGSLDVYPKDVSFATQNQKEVIFIKIRSHVIININWVIRGLLLAAAPFLVLMLFNILIVFFRDLYILDSVAELLESFVGLVFSIPATLAMAIGLFYYSTIISLFYLNFINWYFNIYLVTNERMMHIQLKAFIGKNVSEARLDKIEDIAQSSIGFFPSVFNYGDVRVQTAAQKSRFFFQAIPDPTWFRDVLSDLAKLVKISEP